MPTVIAANISRASKDWLPSEVRHPTHRWSREDEAR